MTDPQFRSWFRNKMQAAAARPAYKNGKRPRFAPIELIENLEEIVREAKVYAMETFT